MDIAALLAWLEASPLAASIRNTIVAFPLVESGHVIGITLVFGTILVIDLRLLGLAWTRRPFSLIADEVLRWTWIAFAIAAVTGALMFITNAAAYYNNWYFRAKMLLLVLAGLNMVFFEITDRRSVLTWDRQKSAPPAGRLVAAASLAIWIGVIFLGRWVAYAPAATGPPPGEEVDFEKLEELLK
ncbi:MAG: hypothetical protein FJW14_05935 [Acidimicrobiia bacterium]|nr:hypothetical protein [Acidimicrobiia bacterium]